MSVHSCFVNTPEEPAAFMFSLPGDGSRGSYRTLISSNQTKQCYISVFPFKCTYCLVSLWLKHMFFLYSLFVQHSPYLAHGADDAKYFHGNIFFFQNAHFANEYFILTERIPLSHTCMPTLTRTSCTCRARAHTHTQHGSKHG